MTKNIDEMPNEVAVEGLASSYDTGAFIPEHSHETHQIVHSISGAMRVQARGMIWIVPPGRALWIPAHVRHSIQCTNRVEMRTVYLGTECAAVYSSVVVLSVSPLLRETLVRLSDNRHDLQTPYLVSLLLIEIVAMNVENLGLPEPKDARVARLVTHLLEQPDDKTPLRGWAKHLGFSERNLIRYIRSETGMSFRELRRQIRVITAIEKLSGGQSVTNVALDVGFETPSAFIHAFRMTTGVTPGKYIL
jgi:AraC-like DNA-binding protein